MSAASERLWVDRGSVRVLFWRFLIIATCCISFAAPARALELERAVANVPNPREHGGWVADPAHVIDRRVHEIDSLADTLEHGTGAELAVVILPSIGELSPKLFATELFAHWGVGKKGRDNGVLVLHVLDQRRVEIETGYGLEGDLPDIKCHWLIDDIAVPFFRAGSFSDGHRELVRGLIFAIEHVGAGRETLRATRELVPGAFVDPTPAPFELRGTQRSFAEIDPNATLTWVSFGGLLIGVLGTIYGAASQRTSGARQLSPRAAYDSYERRAALHYGAPSALLAAGALHEWQSLSSCWSLGLFIPTWFLVYRRRRARLKFMRESPRRDPIGRKMRRLTEAQEDAFLNSGQQTEEDLRTWDYDVWIGPDGQPQIERYKGAKHRSATECPGCGFRTWQSTRVTLVAATTSSGGLDELTHVCAHCGKELVETVTTAQLSESSSSGGSSSSSSSSSDSFGGGSSGGGGSGDNY